MAALLLSLTEEQIFSFENQFLMQRGKIYGHRVAGGLQILLITLSR
jgi:hypothetical protein